jgi:hypothetical protein
MVKARIHLRQLVVLLLLACALAGSGIYWFRARRAAPPSDLVAYLPSSGASVIYIDVDALRRSGILSTLAGSKTTEEPDYVQFVRETKFDYRQDLDALAAALKDGRVYIALRGRFHWSNLRDYAAAQAGSCHNDFCVVAGSQPNRRISFYELKSDVLAMAVGPDDFAAYQVSAQSAKPIQAPPQAPTQGQPQAALWAVIPAEVLQSAGASAGALATDSFPAAAKAYVPALQGAEQIVFSIGPGPDRQLQLGARVTCKDTPAASALLTQLEGITKALRELAARQRQKPDPSDLSNLLVAGSFRREDRQVYGAWPIPKAFVDVVTGSLY